MKRSITLTLLLVAIFARLVNAAPVTFYFEGVVERVWETSDEFSSVSPGDIFTGTFTFESEVEDSDARANVGRYTYSSLSPSGMTMTVQFDGITLVTASNPDSYIEVYNDFGSGDDYYVYSDIRMPSGYKGGADLSCGTRNNSTFLTSDNLPTTAPNINLADWKYLIIFEEVWGMEDTLVGQITSLVTVSGPPPEPVDLSLHDIEVNEYPSIFADVSSTNKVYIRPIFQNKGPGDATGVMVEFYIDEELLGVYNSTNIGASNWGNAEFVWDNLNSWEEAKKLRVRLRCDQEDLDLTNNEYEIIASIYYSNLAPNQEAFKPFEPKQDGYNFPNFPMLEIDFRDGIEMLIASAFPRDTFSQALAYSILVPILPEESWKVFAHCYGMASTSIIYKLNPSFKPVDGLTYNMEFEDYEVRKNIVFYHNSQGPHSLEWLFYSYLKLTDHWIYPALYNPALEYSYLIQSIKYRSEPIILIGQFHAVTAYKIIEVVDPRFPEDSQRTHNKILCYDNLIPGNVTHYNKPGNPTHYIDFLPNGRFSEDTICMARQPLLGIVADLARHWLTQLVDAAMDELLDIGNKLISVGCPAETLITTEYGMHIGYRNGQEINEIPGAKVSKLADETFFSLPMDLTYTVTITGLGVGECNIAVTVPATSESVIQYSYASLPLYDGSHIVFTSSHQNHASPAQNSIGETVEPDCAIVVVDGDELIVKEVDKCTVELHPNVLNMSSAGKWITCYVEPPEGRGVSEIDASSLKLQNSISPQEKPTEISDFDKDGIPDLMVKFDRQELIELLGPGDQIVTLTGQLSDGTPLASIDVIRVKSNKKNETGEPESDSAMSEEVGTDLEEDSQIMDFDSAMLEEFIAEMDNEASDIDTYDVFDPEEVAAFMLFEAGGMIGELGPESFNNEESAFELACALDDVFTMLDEDLLMEALVMLESDILEKTDGCAKIGEPDEDDWITTPEGQILLYPLLTETIELLESLI